MYLSEIFLFTLFIFPLQYLSEITYYYNRDKAMIAKMPQNCFHGRGQHKSDDINHHVSAQQLHSLAVSATRGSVISELQEIYSSLSI